MESCGNLGFEEQRREKKTEKAEWREVREQWSGEEGTKKQTGFWRYLTA